MNPDQMTSLIDFADHSKSVLLLWILFVFMFHVYLCYTVVSVPCILVITCWEVADLLALLSVVFSCIFYHFPLWCYGSGMVLDCHRV